MIALALLACGLLADAPPADDRAVYESKRAQAGRDPSAHVKLALWCESHGMPAERLRHLAIAVLTNPSNLAARSLMGLVADNGAWRKPEDIAARAQADAKLSADRAEYQTLRAAAKDDADSQSRLAAWCEEHGLHAEATAHLYRVVRLDPKRESAWKKLGYRKYGNAWLTDAQIAGAKAEVEAQAKADRHWKPILERAKAGASGGAFRPEAARTVAAISDHRAVPSVMSIFGNGNASNQRLAVNILGQIDAPAASRALAFLAAFGKSAEVKRVATETLRQRDPREFAGPLISLLRKPIKYIVKPVKEPGKPGELWVEGERYDRKRLYQSASAPKWNVMPGDRLTLDANGMPVLHQDLGMFNIHVSGAQLYYMMMDSGGGYAAQFFWETGVPPQTTSTSTSAALNSYVSAKAPYLEGTLSRAEHQQSASSGHTVGQAAGPLNPANLILFGAPVPIPDTPLGDWVMAQDNTSFGRSRQGVSLNVNSDVTIAGRRESSIPVGQMEYEASKSAAMAQRQIDADVSAIEAYNKPIHLVNQSVLPALTGSTGQDFGEDVKAWQKWFVDQVGYTLLQAQATARETVVDTVQPYNPQVPIGIDLIPTSYSRISCFGAGTIVRTLDGNRPIESLAVGDLVLAQDESTGAISYQPVLVVHRNPPAATLKIDLGGEAIISSTYHRFWKPGLGWAMARELKPGDRIRTLGGVATVKEIGAEKVQPVFNLDVAESKTFFVGESGVLAHDNSVPDRRATPFDAVKAD